MSDPQSVINRMRRTSGRNLATSVVQEIRNRLLLGGFVLLPSDTCYSLGTIAKDEHARDNVNYVLGRGNDPVSIAFSSYQHVRQWVKIDQATAALLEHFTPGPITLVCKAKDEVADHFLKHVIGSPDRTIGVRIPDSRIERDIAGCTEHLLMTVAVRDPETDEAIQNFDDACEIVKTGIGDLKELGWDAIEGNKFYSSHSTVVRMGGVNGVQLIREGDIPFTLIQETITKPSGWAVEMEHERGTKGV